MEPPSVPADTRLSESEPTADATVSFLFANVFALGVCGVALLAIGLPYTLLWGGRSIFAGITPLCVVLGLVPALMGLLLGWGPWMVFGVVMIGCAGGDAAVQWAIRRVPGESRVLDHPTEVGCRVFLHAAPERP